MNTTTVDLEELRRLSNGDEKFFNEMLSIFINTTRQEMSVMSEGVKEKNWKKITDSAHKIVPPCRHVGAIALHDLLKAIEKKSRGQSDFESCKKLAKEAETEADKVIAEIEKILAESKTN